MDNIRSWYLSLAVLFVVLTGCDRIQPIYNVQDTSIPAAAHKLSVEQIGSVIMKTALDGGWNVNAVKPGILRCSMKWLDHTAVVEVVFTDRTYSIRHVSSENLKEDAGQIHRKYNNYIHKLQNDIDHALSTAANH